MIPDAEINIDAAPGMDRGKSTAAPPASAASLPGDGRQFLSRQPDASGRPVLLQVRQGGSAGMGSITGDRASSQAKAIWAGEAPWQLAATSRAPWDFA